MKIYEIRKIHEVATRQDADGLITAIKTFQSSAGLNPDGIVGPNTRAKAAELMKNPEQAQLVTTLQTAIKNFQTTAGIGVDGKVGPETMKAVNTAQGLDPVSGKPIAQPAVAKTTTPTDPNAKAGIDGPADSVAKSNQQGTVVKPTQTEPVAKEPVAKEPVVKEPVVKEPVAKEPVAKEPVAKEPVVKEPVAKSNTFTVSGKQMTRQEVKTRIEALLKKKNATEGLQFKSSIAVMLREALTAAEQAELDSLLAVVKDDPEFTTLVKQATAQPSKDYGDNTYNTDSTYTKDGKSVDRSEYEKTFGKDKSGRYNDYVKMMQSIESMPRQAEDEKRKLTQSWLDDPDSKYYKGVPVDTDDPDYPPEFTAIDQKYMKKAADYKEQADKIASDPDIAKLIKSGGDKFDQALSGDDDFYKDSDKFGDWSNKKSDLKAKVDKLKKKAGIKTKDPFADDDDDDFDKALDGDDDYDGLAGNKNDTKTTVTKSGGNTKTTTVKTTGGGANVRWSAKYVDNDKSRKLKAQAKEVRRVEMKAWMDKWDKENPDADKFDFTDDPEYKALKDKASDLKKQSREARDLLYPNGEIKDGKYTYYNKKGKEIKWDGEDHPDVVKLKGKSESVQLNRMKVLAGLK